VDQITRFQEGIEELLQLIDLNDPVSGRSADPTEVGGLHQVVSEL
jgi:hypothetical protein